jgi:hypothetical protein
MSPVSIGEVTSEVVAEPEPATTSATGAATTDPWEQAERLRAGTRALARDAERTRAEGYCA